jgi:hypothetical protein
MKQSTLHHSKKQVFEAVKQAATSLDLEIKNQSSADGTLTLFSNGGLFSFGNKIDVQVKISEPSKSVLKVSSVSAAEIQLIDWGTNSDLESSLIDEVKNILQG